MTKREWRGTEHIPSRGGAILVANHLSHFDPFVVAHFVYGSGRWPHFLAKASLFTLPVVGRLMRAVQQIPVHRGSADAARALESAIEAIQRGNAVIIYPEGTTTSDPDLWPSRGKTGIARLALAARVPVIPLVTWGPQKIFHPHTRTFRFGVRVPMIVSAGPPIDLSPWLDKHGEQINGQVLQEVTETVMAQLRSLLVEVRHNESFPDYGTSLSSLTDERVKP